MKGKGYTKPKKSTEAQKGVKIPRICPFTNLKLFCALLLKTPLHLHP
jgi:hypothetical protein